MAELFIIKGRMKQFPAIFLAVVFYFSPAISGNVQHVIMFNDGHSRIGLIDSLDYDAVHYFDIDDQKPVSISMDDVYYIYEDLNQSFYFSPSFFDRLTYAEERGGYIVTVQNDTMIYDQITFNSNLIDPVALVYLSDGGFATVPILDIHSIRVDKTVIEHSVRKGARATSIAFLVSVYFQLKDSFSNAANYLPKLVQSSNGKQYQSITFLFPAATMGWMTYDLIVDKRTSYIRPLDREDTFPRSMFVFSLKRKIKGGLRNQWKQMFPKKNIPKILAR